MAQVLNKIKKSANYIVILSILSSFFIYISFQIVPNFAFAATSWTQTDWSDPTQYFSLSNVDNSTAGKLILSATDNWYNTDWKYRKKITFDNSEQTENLENFPVLVKLDLGTDIDYSRTEDNGEDIRFTDSDGTSPLKYEIEEWNESGSSYVWVKVPQIDGLSSTDSIYMYYGNTGASDAQDAENVWTSNYKAVWHMNSASWIDSISNNLHGVAVEQATTTPSGKIGTAGIFDGDGDCINIPATEILRLDGDIVQEAWFKGTMDGSWSGITNFGETAWDYGIWVYENKVNFYAKDLTPDYREATTVLTSTPWYHVTTVYNATTEMAYVYLDGELRNPPGESIIGSINYAEGSFLQINFPGSYPFEGIIDEVRISTEIRFADSVAATFKSESDNFNTFSSEERRYTSSGTLTSSVFDIEQGGDWGTLTYKATTPTNTSVSVKVRTSDNPDMSGATDFNSCTAVDNNTDISSNNCVTDTDRYIQYQVILSTSDANTPVIKDITITYSPSQLPATGGRILPPLTMLVMGGVVGLIIVGERKYQINKVKND